MSISLIEHNPLLKKPILQLLSLCEQHPDWERGKIEEDAKSSFEELASRQSSNTIIDILVRNEALTETTYVDGEVYEGSLQDIQTDASIPEDVVVERYLSITDSGIAIIDEYAGDKKLLELLNDKPHYEEVFIKMLETCASPEGCNRVELEKAINAMPQLAADERGVQQVYPQFFIDSLETVGALVWQDSWHTTDVGRTVMQ